MFCLFCRFDFTNSNSMNSFYLILWVCLWPIACAIEGYICAKYRIINGEGQPTKEAKAFSALMQIFIWAMVANYLA